MAFETKQETKLEPKLEPKLEFVKALGCEDAQDQAILFYRCVITKTFLYVFIDKHNLFHLYKDGGECIMHAAVGEMTRRARRTRICVLSEQEFAETIDKSFLSSTKIETIKELSARTKVPLMTLLSRIAGRKWPVGKSLDMTLNSSLKFKPRIKPEPKRKSGNDPIYDFGKAILDATYSLASKQLRPAA